MSNWLRYGRPRRYLLRLCDWLPGRAEGWLLDFLYPDDARITFHDVGGFDIDGGDVT